MKNAFLVLALAVLLPALSLRADPPPMFDSAPPDPAAAALVEAYLPLLAAGDFEAALDLQDLRGMRQYLLEKRLADLKARNSELTEQDLEQISAKLQVSDLAPARLRQIMLEVLQEAGYPGITWRVRGYAPAPGDIGGYLASIEARTPEGKEKPILLGLVQLGAKWRIAPAILEEMMGSRPVVRTGPGIQPPPQVAARVDAFWTPLQAGEPDKAYAEMGATYRARVPLLVFLEQAQAFLGESGVPNAWTIVRGIETAPKTLVIGVTVQGSRATRPTLMVFRQVGQTWVAEDVQFKMPGLRPDPVGPGLGRPDLKPDLAPDLDPAAAGSGGDAPAPAAPAAPVRIQPDAPIGPDSP